MFPSHSPLPAPGAFRRRFALLFLCGMGVAGIATAGERPFVHSLFTDGMVLQRDTACPVWGWSTPADRVTVRFAGQEKSAVAAADGRWEVRLDPLTANDSGRDLTIESATAQHTETLKNVLVGDVWLCSGQSNMEWGIGGVNQWWNELPSAPVNGIRLFWVQPNGCFSPVQTVQGSWSVADRGSLLNKKMPYMSPGFSAIAWFFGRAIHRETGIPVGLIESSQGNTAIQSWCTQAGLRASAKYPDDVTSLSGFETMHANWARQNDPAFDKTQQWIRGDFDDSSWESMEIPQDWSKTVLPGFQGLVWLRRHVTVTEDAAGKPMRLHLGAVHDATAVWWDGTFLGAHDSTRRNLDGSWIDHVYEIPAERVTTGDHVIVVRVLGTKGLTADAPQIVLQGDGGTSIPLAGNWRFRQGTPTEALKSRKSHPSRLHTPGGLFNGMIAPLAPFAIKGVLWYQGEGNAGQSTYAEELSGMIRDWRAIFPVGDFPFYIVQLAGFGKLPAAPGKSGWAITRELQAKVAREEPLCGLAVAIDRGEIYDIHPPNKRDVGERLALVALARTYGRNVVCEGPTYREMKLEQDRIRLFFDHAKGLKSLGSGPAGFAIAGEDRQWAWAQARIENEEVVVWSPAVSKPVAVRYAWGDNTLCNLYNEANLPAVPFRTNSW